MRTKPAHVHDCDRCTYLGTVVTEQGEGRIVDHDLYFCDGCVVPTVIARYSSEGPDYASGMCFGDGQNFELTIAKTVAKQRGLIS